LYSFVTKNFPWPLASFNNKRSFCYIKNFCFVINEILLSNINSGIYNVCDDECVSTNELVNIIASTNETKPILLFLPKSIVIFIGKIGDYFSNTFNSERLKKLTQNFVVNNSKLTSQLNTKMPYTSREAFIETFLYYKKESKSI